MNKKIILGATALALITPTALATMPIDASANYQTHTAKKVQGIDVKVVKGIKDGKVGEEDILIEFNLEPNVFQARVVKINLRVGTAMGGLIIDMPDIVEATKSGKYQLTIPYSNFASDEDIGVIGLGDFYYDDHSVTKGATLLSIPVTNTNEYGNTFEDEDDDTDVDIPVEKPTEKPVEVPDTDDQGYGDINNFPSKKLDEILTSVKNGTTTEMTSTQAQLITDNLDKDALVEYDEKDNMKVKPNVVILPNKEEDRNKTCSDVIDLGNNDGVHFGHDLYSTKLDTDRNGIACDTNIEF